MTKGQQDSIGLSATCTDESITLRFDQPGSYRIWKKGPKGETWGYPIWERPIGTEFIDANVEPGVAFEYKVEEINTKATGYLLAGSKIPIVDNRGKLVLIVERTHAADLNNELVQFMHDLASDGYEVIRRDVGKNDSPESVRGQIKVEFLKAQINQKSGVETVTLFGAVPVRMSGPINWDGHGEGMVAADGYYADMTGDWSGSPGIFPAKLDLIVGRIDFSKLTCYSNKPNNPRSELDLYRQWLNRNHRFRTGQWPVTPRGAIRDGFPDRDFSWNGWGNIPQLCRDGIEEIADGQFFSKAVTEDYSVCHLSGGGQLTSMAGVGGSDDFALNNIRVPFVMLLGSAMLGRWDVESGFVRSCLASGDDEKGCLVAFGAGAPHVFLHSCGLGEPIGSAWLRSVNNFKIYPGTGNPEALTYTPAESDGIPPCLARVHQALFGDPTLGFYPVEPVTDLVGVPNGAVMSLAWNRADDEIGWHVYRSASANGPFTRLTTDPLTFPTFRVTDHFEGLLYMVKAVKLVETPSGSFYAASTGVQWSDSQTPPMPPDPGTIMSKVNFIGANSTDQGNWIGKYGQDGRWLAYGVKINPAYAMVTPIAVDQYPWSQDTQDVRGLQTAVGPMGRIAAVWVSPMGFTVEIKSDALPHRLALYLLDWDRQTRIQSVEVLDSATGGLLDKREIAGFSEGIWLVYDFQGSIRVRITNQRIGLANCVLSGIFFSPAGSTLAPVPTPKTRTLEILSSPVPNPEGPWKSRGNVEVETSSPTEFYRLRIL